MASRSFLALALLPAAFVGCPGERPGGADEYSRTHTNPTPVRSGARPTLSDGAPDPASPTVGDIKQTPQEFVGEQISLTGQVDEILDARAFELEGSLWAFGDNIFVLARSPVSFDGEPLARGDRLVVDGTVRRFAADLEPELGWDLSPELEARLTRRPVLVAAAIRRLGPYDRGRWTADVKGAPAQPVRSIVPIVTSDDIHVLAGLRADLGRERVQAVTGKGVWVGPTAMSRVFVLPNAVPSDLRPGEFVHVSGVLRRVPEGAATTWELPPAMSDIFQGEWLFIDAATVREVPATPISGNRIPPR